MPQRGGSSQADRASYEFVKQTLEFLARHGYSLLFFWLLVEQAGLPLPSVPLLLACGALARTGTMDWRLVLLCGLAACLIADNIWFQLGKRRGTRILRLICRISLEPDSCVRQTENAYSRYGMRSLLAAKFIPGLNTVAAPLAGRSGSTLTRFLLFDSMGASIWLVSITSLGYLFADQLEDVAAYAIRTGSGLVTLIAVVLTVWIVWKYGQRRRFLRSLEVARITVEDLQDKLQAGEDVLMVDVRNIASGDPAAIPGAVMMRPEEMAARHREIPRDRDVILVCS
jgi:membrane protein DedA with SNARE-associated domain